MTFPPGGRGSPIEGAIVDRVITVRTDENVQ